MSKSVKYYIKLVKERKPLAEDITSTFEKFGGWKILFPPRTEEKSEQISKLATMLDRMAYIDVTLSDLETSDDTEDEVDYPPDYDSSTDEDTSIEDIPTEDNPPIEDNSMDGLPIANIFV